MAMTGTQIGVAFAEEAGAASTLAGSVEVYRWFSEGQARLNRYIEKSTTLTWAAGALTVALPADFISVSKLDFDDGVAAQDFRVFGRNLILDSARGTTAAGTARLYYWGERTAILADADVSVGTLQEDYACLYYALSRLYRKLTSNRVQYTRYSTLLGANAITVGDLQAEADRYVQDFQDARNDLPPPPPSSFYGC